jgi:hypothetical protein
MFCLREYWIDIGKLDELERAKKEWVNVNPVETPEMVE